MIGGPVWAGKCPRQIAEWKRWESGLNELLAHTDARLICAYDTRTVSDHVVEAAWATPPAPCGGGPGAAMRDVRGLRGLRAGRTGPASAAARGRRAPRTARLSRGGTALRTAAGRAAGPAGVRVALVETPANEALTWLPARGAADAELRVWEERGAVVWDVLAPGREAALPGPCAGFVPPGPEAGQHDGSGCCGVRARRWSCAARTTAARFRLRSAGPRTLQWPWPWRCSPENGCRTAPAAWERPAGR
ncbi:MEDS domain-containing protein [Streptomyces maoxianensis]|uniref:MEDS domain-containing protein n=1 Tax=Streptomyces maoxianensis TaxID=1459942 RepID=A0ABV9GF41_9ACTN